MGTYLYFGTMTNEKTRSTIAVSDKDNYYPYNMDLMDSFFGNVPEELVPEEYKYNGRTKSFINREKTKMALNKVNLDDRYCLKVFESINFNYLDVRRVAKISSYDLKTDFEEEPFVLTEENLLKYLEDFKEKIDEEEDLSCKIILVMDIIDRIRGGQTWFNLNSQKR